MVKTKRVFFIAIIVAICSQFQINYFVEGFIITLSVIVLPILLYFNKGIHPLKICLTVAVISPVFRGIIEFISFGQLRTVIFRVGPDIIFYVVYGMVYYLLFTKKKRGGLQFFLLAVFLADALANTVELSVRGALPTVETARVIFGIAFVRMVVIGCVLVASKHLRWLATKEEQEKRYRRLMMMTSSFKGEIYYMNKNMERIEAVMKDAYRLHKGLRDDHTRHEWVNLSLDVTRNIHEVKKDYIRVIGGLEASASEEVDLSEISLKEAIDVLVVNTKEVQAEEGRFISFKTNINCNLPIRRHYYFMTILGNLVNNAIEAYKPNVLPRVEITCHLLGDDLSVSVKDSASGIEKDELDYIFNLGYSTKYKEGSGDACRGVGLGIVKDLVEQEFSGVIKLNTEPGSGSEFKLLFPVNQL